MWGNLKSNQFLKMLYFKPILPLFSFPLYSLSYAWFQVSVQLEASPAFLAVPVEKEQAPHCICANGRQTVSWAITPKSLGEQKTPRDNSLLKDCIWQWEPYIECYFLQEKTTRCCDFFPFVFYSKMPTRISSTSPPWIISIIHLSFACFRSCFCVLIKQKFTEHWTFLNLEFGGMEEGEDAIHFYWPFFFRKCEFHCERRGTRVSRAVWDWGAFSSWTRKERHSHQASVGWSK